MDAFLTVLPMALVMSAGPQIVSATVLATGHNARRCSVAFLVGVAAATTLGVALAYVVIEWLIGDRGADRDASDAVDYAIIALLLFLLVRVYLHRKRTDTPGWMGKLQTATPLMALALGFVLYFAMPTDVVTMVTVGSWLANDGAPLAQALGFLLLTLLIAALPLTMLLALGDRADVLLPRLRDWMNANSWIVSEAVIVFFLVMTLRGLG
jgi:threonine/homoserine/homoserine lactone efflux protein